LLRALRGEVVVKGEFSQTHGIEIRQLSFAHPDDTARLIQLNTWDFGGQVIYHATHQFIFLSDHALFVLVWSARRGVQQADLPYWLDMIRSRAPHAKVLLVATHLDEAKAVDLDFDALLKQYPDLLHETSFAVSCTEGTNIDGLAKLIQSIASQIRAVDYEWPSHWLRASQALCARPENLMSVSEARGILASHGVDDGAAQETLLRWLHELGDVIYYPDVEELDDTVLLKPEWITQSVAQILDDQEVKDSQGVLKPQHLSRLWAGVDVKLQRILTALMDHYDLTYPTEVNNERIVVECLQHKPTDYLPGWQKTCGAAPHPLSLSLRSAFPARYPNMVHCPRPPILDKQPVAAWRAA
jgi:internalin A